MTRAPGPAGDDPEPEGGRAAERLRQMMLERFGTPERPEPPDAGPADIADHEDVHHAGGDGAAPVPSGVEGPGAASPVDRPADAEDPERS